MSLAAKAAKIGKLSTIYMLSTIIVRGVGLFLLPIFTHYLDPGQMGIVTLAGQVMLPLTIVTQLGLWTSLKSHYFRTPESIRPVLVRTVFLGQLVQAGVICSLLSVVGIWTADWFLPNLPLNYWHVYCLWLMIVWGCFFRPWQRMASGLAQLHERAFTAVFLTISEACLRIGLGLLVVVCLGWRGFGRTGSITASMVIIGSIGLVVSWRYGRERFELPLFRKVVITGLAFVPSTLSIALTQTVNAWLLTDMVDVAAMGVYGVAIMFPQLIQMFLLAFGNAAFPTIARMMADGSQEIRRQQARLYTFVFLVLGAISLGVCLFASPAIRLLTDPAYHEAVYIAPILSLAWLAQSGYTIVSQPVFFKGGGLWFACANMASLLATVVLSLVLIPAYGIYGAAWAMVGGFTCRLIVISLIHLRLYRLPWEIRNIVMLLIVLLTLGAIDYLFANNISLIWSIAAKIALFISFPLLMMSTGVVRRSDWTSILQTMSRKKKGGDSK